MPTADPAVWSERLRLTLGAYAEPLLRQVAGQLARPRNQWPADELIDRCAATVVNPVVIDRRLQELSPAARQLLALVGLSRQPVWAVGNLVEMALMLGHADGLAPVLALLEGGLLYPDLGPSPVKLKSFEQWLAAPGPNGLTVFAHPQAAARAVGEDLFAGVRGQGSGVREEEEQIQASEEDNSDSEDLPSLSSLAPGPWPLAPGQEADGLEWLLRLGVVWQQAATAPFRRTMGGDFFKRDFERLLNDPLLAGPPADHLADVPHPGFLAAVLAEQEGLLVSGDSELRAGEFPPAWEESLPVAVASLWAALPRVVSWNSLDGWRGGENTPGNPFPSAQLIAFLLLTQLPPDGWARPAAVQEWVTCRHPYWASESVRPSRLRPWCDALFLGIGYHLKLVQAARDAEGQWCVRLSPLGRWLLAGDPVPAPPAAFPQTLLVQPNLEILAYRQGLTPALVARLTRLAAWTSVGAACTLKLEAETVYRALESGQTFESLRRTLEQCSSRPVPETVLGALRTWADKRERITLYPSATLMEFANADDLNEALARGLPGVRLGDRLAVVVGEGDIDYRHFRLTGARDYGLPPEKCVTVEADGVTLLVDAAKSDLLLETELPRFAEVADRQTADGKRVYRLTPASLAVAREGGMSVAGLEVWFQQRTGGPLPSAARLLMDGPQTPPPRLRRCLVLTVDAPETADGLVQWPATRDLIADRLGPTALLVADEHVPALRERLATLGIVLGD